ncbi:uncharacterized protein LOC111038726 isoform X1 [Myzus persicae]|uniref:uncharacterized protein LOC111038726 isoform X1 n=1 Tax=Myzus persicae TaxID=13164 RepID=UPI000B92FD4F|nr:uncharacterized protein LOC111038726 isoform X1 [Myzus persicae]
MYPESSFIENFEKSQSNLLTVLKEKIKDTSSKKQLDEMLKTSYLTENCKNAVLFFLLHSVFIPSSRKTTRDENGKISSKKFSIRDSQNSFVILGKTSAELEELISKKNTKIQPCLLIIGEINDPKQIMVYFDGIKYIINTIVKAIEICFNIYYVFNIEYPLESSNFWLFIQIYYFKIKTMYDKPCIQVNQTIAQLKAYENYNIT